MTLGQWPCRRLEDRATGAVFAVNRSLSGAAPSLPAPLYVPCGEAGSPNVMALLNARRPPATLRADARVKGGVADRRRPIDFRCRPETLYGLFVDALGTP